MTQPKPAPALGVALGCIRTSTADLGRKYSPAWQRDAIEAAARREDTPIAEWFVDHESGTPNPSAEREKLRAQINRHVKRLAFQFYEQNFAEAYRQEIEAPFGKPFIVILNT
jgi:hypothetical protein